MWTQKASNSFFLSISRLDSVRYESHVCYSVGTYICFVWLTHFSWFNVAPRTKAHTLILLSYICFSDEIRESSCFALHIYTFDVVRSVFAFGGLARLSLDTCRRLVRTYSFNSLYQTVVGKKLKKKKIMTLNGGSLGSWIDEERSKVR